MDETRPTGETPRFEPTPEAHPLDPAAAEPGASAAHQERAAEEAQGTTGTGSQDTSPALPQTGDLSERTSGPATAAQVQPSAGAGDPMTDRAREVTERLKPVAVAAEEVAAKAVDLSVKGLTKLSALLERRRQERGTGDGPSGE